MGKCKFDSDCMSFQVCSNFSCTHKGIENPLPLEILAWIILPIGLGMINIGGNSGALMKVPLLVLLIQYEMKDANMIQYLPLVGAAFANIFFIFTKRHPNINQPLIEYDFVMIIFPALVFGTTIGLILNQTTPEFYLSVGLMMMLLYTSYTSAQQARNYIKKQLAEKKATQNIPVSTGQDHQTEHMAHEEIAAQARKDQNFKEMDDEDTHDQQQPGVVNQPPLAKALEIEQLPANLGYQSENNPEYAEYSQIMNSYQQKIPKKQFLQIFGFFVIFFTIQFLIGNQKVESIAGIELCSGLYWGLAALRFLIVIAYSLMLYRCQKQEYQILTKFGYQNAREVNANDFITIFIIGFLSGFFAGFIGIGGTIIMVPYMIGKGYLVPAASASGAFNNVIVATTTLITIILQRKIETQIMIFYSLYSFFGSFLTTYLLTYISIQKQMDYLGILCTVFLLSTNVVCMVIYFSLQYPQKSYFDLFEKKGTIC